MLAVRRLLLCKGVVPAAPKQISAVKQLYTELVSPGMASTTLATLANELLPQLGASSELSVAQKYHILATLSARGVRHEGVLQKCIWDVLKADHKGPQGDGALFNYHLASCTASTFHIMTRHGFKNDHQMTSLALGRCIELAAVMSLPSIVKVYQGLAEMNQAYFSISSVALYESDVKEDFTLIDDATSAAGDDCRRTLAELANQPNLIDVVCAELENRLLELAQGTQPLTLDSGGETAVPTDVVSAETGASSVAAHCKPWDGPEQSGKKARLLLLLSPLLSSLATVGATSSTVFSSLQSLFELTRVDPESAPLPWQDRVAVASSLVTALRDTAMVNERVIDPMNHVDSVEFSDARATLTQSLALQLSRLPGAAAVMRGTPPLVLSARNLFERAPELAEWCPELWDQVRTVRVAHKHVVAARAGSRPTSPRLGGKLFDKRFAVKVKSVTQDLSRAEQFVPPQFKTWRSPAHQPRGGHAPSSRGPGRVVKFGTRRISKNYLKDKRKKFSRA